MGPSLDAKLYKKEIYKCEGFKSFKNYMLRNAFKENLVWPHEVSQRILLIAILLSIMCNFTQPSMPHIPLKILSLIHLRPMFLLDYNHPNFLYV